MEYLSQSYQDIPPEDVPEVRLETGTKTRVLVGESHGVRGAVEGIAIDPLYLDVHVPSHTLFSHFVLPGHTAFCYIFEGEGSFGSSAAAPGCQVGVGSLAVLSDGERMTVSTAATPVRFLLLAGKPLPEPVARYGPFVMNTQEEIIQAFEEYQKGTFLD